ncbi:long-chain fatty acyl ligase [Micractinium conductrix]|uniref:Long-chain fatty acyl ligase n=1 Tax=Micractinium conductrix TaxID=554055 RepID=A0A2P6V6F9_9CHLO|nr:long-chain fatty acyl ligase [Micractinium conductrix]|eukprot:PSC69675.1 long-chain fatty acyl ligase [Micractinium conductrix]
MKREGRYIVEVEGARAATADRPAQGPAYRSAMHTDFSFPHSKTLYDNFEESVARYTSYKDVGEQVAAACNRQTVYCVPLYDSLGDSTVQYILDHSESSIVFCSAAKVHVLAAALPMTQRTVRHVVVWGDTSGGPAATALQDIHAAGLPVHGFHDFVRLGKEHPVPPVPPTPEDLCTIMYTSGTTGTPKGVRLTHHMVASEVAAFSFWLDRVGIPIGEGDVYLSFLPLAHIYDRVMEETWLKLACQPTIFCSVPRIYERFFSGVTEKLKSAGLLKRTLFNWASKLKLAALRWGYTHEAASPCLDNLLFKPISKQLLGSRIRLAVSGGAPLAKHVEDFMRVTCCAIFLQGAGLTETCAATFVDYPNEPDHFASVGPPGPAFWMRLEAVPEMGYDPLGFPPRGEVLIKGDPVFRDYHKDEEETRKALDSEGWFHSGDVGELSPNGSLRIVDRKKNIFKLSQGEYIAVEKIEGVLLQSPLLWVHSSHFESCLVAVAVPAKAPLVAWAGGQGLPGDYGELCRSEQAQSMVQRELEAAGRAAGLKGFEVPKAVHLEGAEPFSVDNNLLTPTFKMRRPQQAQKLAEQFMGGGEGKQGEAPVGDRPAGAAPASTTGGGGLMSMAQGMATEYFAGQGGNEAKPVGGGPTAAPAGGGSGLMGMAQGLAGEYFTGSEGKQVEGSSGGAMDVGLVDKLLAAFQHKEGKQFQGTDGEFDQLAGMAHGVLGTPIGRELLKSWVKQRMGCIILEKLEAQGTALTALSDGMKKMADVQEAQGTTLTALSDGMKKMADAQEAQGKALTARGTALNALGKALTGQGQLVGGLAGRLVRSERVHCGLDKQYRPEKLASSVDDLLGICSVLGFPAFKEPLLEAFAGKLVQAARPKGSGKPAWLPALKALQGYASAARGGQQLSYLRAPKQGQVVLMLAAALTANQQVEVLQFDLEPVLELRPTGQGGFALVLDMVETKSSHSAVLCGRRIEPHCPNQTILPFLLPACSHQGGSAQLETQARILAFVLVTANPQLLEAHGPLQVKGTVEVLGKPTPAQRRRWAGEQRALGCSVAPGAPTLAMQLFLQW